MRPVMKYISPTRLQVILKYYVSDLSTVKKIPQIFNSKNKYFHTTAVSTVRIEEKHSLTIFDAAKGYKKEKATFLAILHAYVSEEQRSGHVAFIYGALRYMDEFGVNEDLEVYKQILNTMPKGKYVASNLLQAEFMHYPREQQCIIDVLEKMENNGVIPDPEMELLVLNIIGKHAYPVRKLRRMAYWQNKFKNLNPWSMPRPLPSESLELAKLAIRKIASVDVQSKITIFDTENVENSIDKTWIVSASSPDQEKLIAKHPKDVAAYVEGPYRIWISKVSVDYFILRADVLKQRHEENIDTDDLTNLNISVWKKAKKQLALYRSIHEQDDKTIFGVCATGTSSKDSLLSWIRCLQERNPALLSIPILFKFIGIVDDCAKIEPGDMKPDDPEQIPGETSKQVES